MGALNRRLRALERRIVDKDFRASAPPLDSEGMPNWDGSTPLTAEGFMRAMGFAPDEELSAEELETRKRLAPFAEVFETLQRDEKAEVGP